MAYVCCCTFVLDWPLYDLDFSVEDLQFLRPLEDQEVKEVPGTATFECEISKPGLPAQWFRAGKPIKAGDKYTMTEKNGVHTLVVKKVTPDDEAEYSVKIREVSTAAKLTVAGREEVYTLYSHLGHYNYVTHKSLIFKSPATYCLFNSVDANQWNIKGPLNHFTNL